MAHHSTNSNLFKEENTDSNTKLIQTLPLNQFDADSQSQRLEPQLNVFQGAAIIAGAMIGTGVYATPSKVLSHLNATGTSLLVWLGGAAVAFIGAMAYGEWGCRVTESGGDAPFLNHVYTKPKHLVAILYTWVRIIVINPGYSASAAFLIGSTLTDTFPHLAPPGTAWQEWTPKCIGVLILTVETLLCIPSNRMAGTINLGVTIVSVLCLCCIIVIGLLLLCKAFPGVILSNFHAEVLFKPTTTDPSQWALAIFNVMWAYDGWFNLASCLGELKNPEKNIFKSTLLGLGLTGVLFLMVNVAFLLGVPYQEFIDAGTNLPQIWGHRLFGPPGKYFITVLYAVTLAACLFNTLFSSSRIAQAAGESKLTIFPHFLSKLNPRFGTPLNALLVNLVFSAAVLLGVPGKDGFTVILMVVSYPVWLFITLTLAGLIYLKFKENALWRKPKQLKVAVWVNVFGPSIVVVLGLFLLVFPFVASDEERLASGVGLAIVSSGILPYFWIAHYRKGK